MWRIRTLAAISVLFLLGGCLELEIAVALNRDGSGTQSLHLGMTERMLDAVKVSARALNASGTRADPLAVYDREQVARQLGLEGLTIENYRSYREGVRQVVDVVAKFGKFAQLRGSTLFGGAGEWFVLTGRNKGGVRLIYYPQGHQAWLDAKKKAREIQAQPSAVQKQFFDTQKKRIAGLDVTLKLTLPGEIDYTSSNMTTSGKFDAVCSVKAANIKTAADLVRSLAPRFEVEFDGRGCTISLDSKDPGIPAPKPSK